LWDRSWACDSENADCSDARPVQGTVVVGWRGLVGRLEHQGPTKVPELKAELGVPQPASLWLVRPGGKPIQLVDHATHDVKAGDRFETVVKGGVS
jgi:hypothetical protein